MVWGWDNLRALIGLGVIVGIAWLISENRRSFPLKVVLGAVALQFFFALLLFGVPKLFGASSLFGGGEGSNPIISTLQNATLKGTQFVFGYVGDNSSFPGAEGFIPPIFIFQILPIIIVVAALSAMLWHWKILRYVTRVFAFLFARILGLGGATSLAVSANIFMGMTEAPILVKPYIKGMTRSEIFILMTTGFATIAGSVLVVYVTFLEDAMSNPLAQLLTASFMAAPAAVALALTIVPETAPASERAHEPDFEYQSTMDAFARGASDGLQIVLNIATMLIAALALLYIANALLGALPDICGFANFGSIGILIGGLSIIEPTKRDVFLSLAWKTLLAGTLATCMSGAVVGALPAALFIN